MKTTKINRKTWDLYRVTWGVSLHRGLFFGKIYILFKEVLRRVLSRFICNHVTWYTRRRHVTWLMLSISLLCLGHCQGEQVWDLGLNMLLEITSLYFILHSVKLTYGSNNKKNFRNRNPGPKNAFEKYATVFDFYVVINITQFIMSII